MLQSLEIHTHFFREKAKKKGTFTKDDKQPLQRGLNDFPEPTDGRIDDRKNACLYVEPYVPDKEVLCALLLAYDTYLSNRYVWMEYVRYYSSLV